MDDELGTEVEISIACSAKNLDKKDIIGLSDPFLAFYRLHENGSVTVAHRTEVIKNTLNPSWGTMILPVRLLCNGDLNRYVTFSTFHCIHCILHPFS
uniref:Copine 9 n=1 Tax=Echinococcus granulosus TaxID=6210 RepID=A0A068WQJ9_ECHGR|nr:copine 9 [Echinococcus granulosus]